MRSGNYLVDMWDGINEEEFVCNNCHRSVCRCDDHTDDELWERRAQ